MAEVAAEIETKFFIVRNLSDESQMQRHVNIFLRLGSKMKDN